MTTPSFPQCAQQQSRLAALLQRFAYELQWSEFRGTLRLVVPAESVFAVLEKVKVGAGMDMLVDITAVDLLEYEGATDRFRVVYLLLNTETSERLEINTHVNDPKPTLTSVYSLWNSADWIERETYDMYGIHFAGHPNFKRLLLPQEFAAFPLRKDYPVKGRGERHNFPVITRSES
ncbi:MAG: NADH-quinone oxidoreductase subunit C [Pirellulaceae bacterium]|nr:NADH-quinone oxidoreductase subunit C [Pirellulaceae bacterium]